MISFRPVKTRAYSGINTYERFGQSILNKYKWYSKPYLGMLNLLFLDPVMDQADDYKQNLYSFMVTLRMQLEKQQLNKENNLVAASPFLYKMLEKILIKQSTYGSELKAYRNYITLLNINGVNNNANITYSITAQKAQFLHTPPALLKEQASLAKAITAITVNSATPFKQKAALIDDQRIAQYRKPLIESIWMNRIANHTSTSHAAQVINQLYRAANNTEHLHTMNSVERIIRSQRILKQVYELGVQHDVFELSRQQLWYNEPIELTHNREHQSTVSNVTPIEDELLPAVKSILLKSSSLSTLEVQKMNVYSTLDRHKLQLLKSIHNQLVPSKWIRSNSQRNIDHSTTYLNQIVRNNKHMLSQIHSHHFEDVFNQRFVVETLNANSTITKQLVEYGIQMSSPIKLVNATPSQANELDMLEVVKSLTVVTNKASHTSNDLVTSNVRVEAINNYSNRIDDKSVLKQYKRQLAHSIWLSRIVQQSQKAIQDKQHYSTTISNRNQRILRDTKHISSTDIFVLSTIEDQLQLNRTAVSYMEEHLVEADRSVRLNKLATLTTLDVAHAEQSPVIDIVKSLTTITNRILNRNTVHAQSTPVQDTNSDLIANDVNYDLLMLESNTFVKQYKRQLSESVWLSRLTNTSYKDTIAHHSGSIWNQNQKNSHHPKSIRTASANNITGSIFEHQHVVDILETNHKAIEYMVEHGVQINRPVQFMMQQEAQYSENDVIDVVKSLTRIVNKRSTEPNISSPNSRHTQAQAQVPRNLTHDGQTTEARLLSKQYNRRLSDSVWLSKMVELSHEQLYNPNINSLSIISKRNKRILNKSIMSISTEIFDAKIVEERLQANRRALNYFIDIGASMEKPVQLTTPSPVIEPDFIQDVAKAITRIEFSNTTMTKSINKYVVQQYRRQLTESIWMKQIYEQANKKSSSRQTTTSDDRYISSIGTDTLRRKANVLNQTSRSIAQQTSVNNTTDLFNTRVVEQRLQHNKLAIQHLQQLGVTISSSVDLLLPDQVSDLTQPVNNVVKAVTRIVAQLPALHTNKSRKVIPIEILRQYRKQLMHTTTTEQHQSVDVRLNEWLQQSIRMKSNNPIIQLLHQKASGSVFDPIVMDERVFRDIATIQHNNSLTNHSIEQRNEALISWLLPPRLASANGASAGRGKTSAMSPSVVQLSDITTRTNDRSVLRRLQQIRSQFYEIDSRAHETVRKYTTGLFTSSELDYLHQSISGISHTSQRQIGVKRTYPSVHLLNTKVAWLQSIVEHLAKSTTISKSSNDRLHIEKHKLSSIQRAQRLQPLFLAPDSTAIPIQYPNQPMSASQPISLVHSTPEVTLDTLNEQLTYRMDQEAAMDYLIPKPAVIEPQPEKTVQPVNVDIQVDQDKVSINPMSNIDMTELVDKLYEELERKMSFERLRRGF